MFTIRSLLVGIAILSIILALPARRFTLNRYALETVNKSKSGWVLFENEIEPNARYETDWLNWERISYEDFCARREQSELHLPMHTLFRRIGWIALDCTGLTEADLTGLTCLNSIRRLDLENPPALYSLPKFSSLECVQIYNSHFKHNKTNDFAPVNTVKSVLFNSSFIGSWEAGWLSSLTNLDTLCFADCEINNFPSCNWRLITGFGLSNCKVSVPGHRY